MSEEVLDMENQKDSGDITNNNYLKRKKKNVGKEINKLLSKDLKNQNPILSKNKGQFLKLDQEAKQLKEEKAKKYLKIEQRKRGYKEGKLWDLKKEKVLLKTATKGVVKLFNSITDYKKKIKEEEKDQEIRTKKKSHNFLQMHGLSNPDDANKKPDINKKFTEDDKDKN